jgi:hypothetical protein
MILERETSRRERVIRRVSPRSRTQTCCGKTMPAIMERIGVWCVIGTFGLPHIMIFVLAFRGPSCEQNINYLTFLKLWGNEITTLRYKRNETNHGRG